MAFSSDERERLPLLSGALTGDDANAAAVRGVGLNRTAPGCLTFELLEGCHGHGCDGDARHDLSNNLRLPP